jgi:hypothetical protein
MTESEFRQMLFDDAGTATWSRTGTPESPVDPAPATLIKSLEEKHLRGWVGPEEFRARGCVN